MLIRQDKKFSTFDNAKWEGLGLMRFMPYFKMWELRYSQWHVGVSVNVNKSSRPYSKVFLKPIN